MQVVLLCGGQSPEHEISVRSVKRVLATIDRTQHTVQLVGIAADGSWWLLDESRLGKKVEPSDRQIFLLPGDPKHPFRQLADGTPIGEVDVVFPVLHGPMGEDGTVQGLLRVLDLPFVGSDVAASAVCMDKDLTKKLLRQSGIPTAASLTYRKAERDAIDYAYVSNQLGRPVFVKPARMGSSVGVSKARNASEFARAIDLAFRFDSKVLIETAVVGRELELAVLGNDEIAVSAPGEIVPPEQGYDFDSKYTNAEAQLHIPAKVTGPELAELQIIARETYRALDCEGLTRVDIFLAEDGEIFVNEPNTLPGFTSISMYPKLWEHAGTPTPELIDALLDLAVERHERQQQLDRGGS